MKIASALALLALGATSALANNFVGRETYLRSGWLGEYPTSFVVKKSVTLSARLAPESQADRVFTECKLKKGEKFGYQATNGNADYYTRSVVSQFRALKEFDLFAESGEEKMRGRKMAAGETIDELTYLSEGICEVRYDGVVFQMTCPSNLGSTIGQFEPVDPTFNPENFTEYHQEWLQLRCNGTRDGGRHWLLMQELEPLFENGTLERLPIEG